MLLSKEDAYPIMTYSQFEDKPTGTLVDPVSVAVEELGKLQEGEQTWIQILIRPTGDEAPGGRTNLDSDSYSSNWRRVERGRQRISRKTYWQKGKEKSQ